MSSSALNECLGMLSILEMIESLVISKQSIGAANGKDWRNHVAIAVSPINNHMIVNQKCRCSLSTSYLLSTANGDAYTYINMYALYPETTRLVTYIVKLIYNPAMWLRTGYTSSLSLSNNFLFDLQLSPVSQRNIPSASRPLQFSARPYDVAKAESILCSLSWTASQFQCSYVTEI